MSQLEEWDLHQETMMSNKRYWPIEIRADVGCNRVEIRTGYGDISDPIRTFYGPRSWTIDDAVRAFWRYVDAHPNEFYTLKGFQDCLDRSK